MDGDLKIYLNKPFGITAIAQTECTVLRLTLSHEAKLKFRNYMAKKLTKIATYWSKCNLFSYLSYSVYNYNIINR